MKAEQVKMIESPESNKKVILKLKHIDVKFNVRGRTLNAIRDVSLEIFDKETIAIVGESGSGKSVLTKTFAGMLDSNGYISHGNVYFSDDELSETDVALNRRNRALRKFALRKINIYTHGRTSVEEYLKIKELQEADLKKKTLSAEEVEEFDKKLKKNDDEINETINFIFSLDKRNKDDKPQLVEAKAKLKGLKKEQKDLWKERKNLSKKKLAEYKQDKEYIADYKAKIEELQKIRFEKYEADKLKELEPELKERNERIADEIVLSIGRYPVPLKTKYSYQLLKRFKDFIWSGKDVSTPKQMNRIFDPVVFRVEKRGVETVEGNKDKVFITNTLAPQFNLPEVTEPTARNKTLVIQARNSYRRLFNHLLKQLTKIVKEKLCRELGEKELRRVKDFANIAIVYAANYDWMFKRAIFTRRFLRWFKDATESDGTDLKEKSKSKPIVTLKGYAIIDCAKVKFTKDWQKIRGRKIATVFQDPMTSLNPILTIGRQIMIVIQKHQKCSQFEAKRRAIDIMAKVGIPDPEKRFYDYPFQYSGGMRQRIVIAIALSCQPKILICDEPTTALDVTIQAQIIRLIKSLSKDLGFTTVYITHDLGVVANVAERVAVLYGGQIVELGTVEEIFYEPLHPYTWALLSSLPQLAQRGSDLFSIPGTPPSLYNKIVGDAFAPRSRYALAIDFKKEPPMWRVSDTHFVKTWLLDPRSPKIEKPEAIQNLHEKMVEAYKDQL
ncbi:MAG: ATP-binding cassette domain-containing protein [Erysipelotrichaceae bacterium]|nr:ATP-binding cassette domain-containing protein [Erysipelotrichaceae bacterium]